MRTQWKLCENTIRTTKGCTSPQKKKKLGPKCMVSHPIETQNVLLSTCVLCHFWPRLMARAWIMGEYYYNRLKKQFLIISTNHGFLGAWFNKLCAMLTFYIIEGSNLYLLLCDDMVELGMKSIRPSNIIFKVHSTNIALIIKDFNLRVKWTL